MRERVQGGGMGITLAVLTGAAVGAGVALMFAPCSGKEARGWLAHRTRSLKDTTSNALAQGRDAVQRLAREVGKDGDGAVMASDRTAHNKPPGSTMRL